jgi:prepilin-type N-terminal cleavage/methylation domain-containing protein
MPAFNPISIIPQAAARVVARRRTGFTIVELLVVISVIAILIALLSVGVVQAGGTARQTKALFGAERGPRHAGLHGRRRAGCVQGQGSQRRR